MSKPSEDICNLCVAFANRHKYKLSQDKSSANSAADEHLFIPEQHPISKDSDEDKEEEECVDDNGEPEEKSTPEQTPEKSQIQELLDNNNAAANDPDLERREQMIGRAYLHVEIARVQRLLYTNLINKARRDAVDKVVHSKRTYTFVVDFGQNMEIPVMNEWQPGATYYYSPLSIYNLGVVDQANLQSDGEEAKDLMYCPMYHKGVGNKGGNNVVSLIHKTLRVMGLLQENDPGLELNIVFDNCSGQNKNNTVLKYLLWLVEMRHFERVKVHLPNSRTHKERSR